MVVKTPRRQAVLHHKGGRKGATSCLGEIASCIAWSHINKAAAGNQQAADFFGGLLCDSTHRIMEWFVLEGT